MTSNHLRIAAIAVALLVWTSGLAVAAPPGDGDQPGPPDELPGPVPDFVGDVLGAIGDVLDESAGSLGEIVSDLTPGGDGTPTESAD